MVAAGGARNEISLLLCRLLYHSNRLLRCSHRSHPCSGPLLHFLFENPVVLAVRVVQFSTMTSTRQFQMNDLFRFNNVNLDVLTETYNMPFYLEYMSKWPDLFTVAEAPNNSIMGYMLGKSEGSDSLWHGHVSAVTVAPLYRRLGLAKTLMEDLEDTSSNLYNAYFVDLFVRASNTLAINMYEKFGYVKYRRVLG